MIERKFMRKDNFRIILITAVFIVFAALFSAVETKFSQAEEETTQTTTTTTQNFNGNKSVSVTTEKTEAEVKPEKKEEGHSILGSFFGFLGNVIAFPFRMVGSAFKAIF